MGNTNSKVPEPPVKERVRTDRNFAKLLLKKYYLLDGEPEYDKNNNLVNPWREGNTYTFVKPLKNKHYQEYLALNNKSLDHEVYMIMTAEQAIWYNATNCLKEDFIAMEFPDEIDKTTGLPTGGKIIGQYGVLYGDVKMAKQNLIAFIFSCCGKVVGRDEMGVDILEGITEEEVSDVMDPHFCDELVEDQEAGAIQLRTVFDEILKYSNIFNSDLVKAELEQTGQLTEDELKNSPKESETTTSVKKPSKTGSVKPVSAKT